MQSGDYVDFDNDDYDDDDDNDDDDDDNDDDVELYTYMICNKSERFASYPIQCVVLYGK